MYQLLEKRINKLHDKNISALLSGSKIGLEKECLRVTEKGTISNTPHPRELGSSLMNPYITTDYAESLLEFITPPFASATEALKFLQAIHKFTHTKLNNEILWSSSMPCVLTGDDSIHIAEFGQSNAGLMKTAYRRGLGHRYGKMMQVIAGIHYNYSLPVSFWNEYRELEKSSLPIQTFISEYYFQMLRNLQRYGWLIPYLFGASPAVCMSFMDGIEKILEPFDDYTYHHPYATSLRLSDIGYQNYKEGKSGIKANYDNLAAYVASLRHAIETPSPDYEKFGTKVGDIYQQLNTNLLQIENEYYSTVRPKQTTGKYEKPIVALQQRGVEYIELRSLDVNVFEPLGVCESQLHFLEAFMIFCLLQESPNIEPQERIEIDFNQSSTAHHGRQPGLKLTQNGKPVLLCAWATEIFNAMEEICDLLDSANQTKAYRSALEFHYQSVLDPDQTPSARILREMAGNQQAFFPYSMDYARKHAQYFKNLDIGNEQLQFFENVASTSLKEQQQMEADDKLDFDEFLRCYFAETLEPTTSHLHEI